METREPLLISVKDVLSAAVGTYRPAGAIASSAGRILRYDYHGCIGHRDEDGQFAIDAAVRYFLIGKPTAGQLAVDCPFRVNRVGSTHR
jgi:hypothetical protein